jgi:2,4-dienoyl-CoA reductase-like NADH-dependent reductase (Old Yellow Enzyme family)
VAFEELFAPIKIGSVKIKNRIVMAAMNGAGDGGGHLSNQWICFFNARALGGFGLLTTGCLITNPVSHEEMQGLVPSLYDGNNNISSYSRLTESIHSMGKDTKVFAQLSPGFGRHSPTPGSKGASPIPVDSQIVRANLKKSLKAFSKLVLQDGIRLKAMNVPREMTVEEIHRDEVSFVKAAEMAVLAGFDGVEIHASQESLLHQFLSPYSNKRLDEYGGPLSNRARYLLELTSMLKANFGDAVPIVVCLSGRDYQHEGITAEEAQRVYKWIEEAGADAIHLSCGSRLIDISHFEADTDNISFFTAQSKELTQAVNIPIITPSPLTPEKACQAVKDGETSMVSLGRQALVDPDWPQKVKEGSLSKIETCIRDSSCSAMSLQGSRLFVRCVKNPNLGFEEFMPEYWPKRSKPLISETLKRWMRIMSRTN